MGAYSARKKYKTIIRYSIPLVMLIVFILFPLNFVNAAPLPGILRGIKPDNSSSSYLTDGNDSTKLYISPNTTYFFTLDSVYKVDGYYLNADVGFKLRFYDINDNFITQRDSNGYSSSSSYEDIPEIDVKKVALYNNSSSSIAIHELDVRSTLINDNTPPATPKGIQATANSSIEIIISWDANTESDLDGYKVYRNGTEIADVSSASYTDTTVEPETTYGYTVAAYDSFDNISEQSSPINVTTPASADTTPPQAPAGLIAAADSPTVVSLSWEANSETDLSGYKVYRDGVEIADVSINEFNDAGLTPETSYSYTVTAYDTNGNESQHSTETDVTTPASEDAIPPAIPAGVTATATSPFTVDVSWNANSEEDLAGYKIYRNGILQKTVAVGVTSWTDLTAQENTAYGYSVSAFDNSGNESEPTVVNVTTPIAPKPPSEPVQARISSTTATSVTITWEPYSGIEPVDEYRLYQNGELVGSVPNDQYQYIFSDIETGAAEYWVTAVNADGEGPVGNKLMAAPSFLGVAHAGDMLGYIWDLLSAIWPLIAFAIALISIPLITDVIKKVVMR